MVYKYRQLDGNRQEIFFGGGVTESMKVPASFRTNQREKSGFGSI
jgi:hypothetical protein